MTNCALATSVIKPSHAEVLTEAFAPDLDPLLELGSWAIVASSEEPPWSLPVFVFAAVPPVVEASTARARAPSQAVLMRLISKGKLVACALAMATPFTVANNTINLMKTVVRI
jgi:hypothetical protein